MADYSEYYDLMEALEKNPRLIQSSKLYNFDDGKLYAALMDMLAQPLASGQESPFSVRSPGTAHGIFMSVIVQLFSYMGYEINLMPDRALVEIFRMMGAEVAPSEYPILNMRFWRSQESLKRGIDVPLDGGLEIRSRFDSDLRVYTQFGDIIDGTKEYVDIPARLNREGLLLADVADGDFTQMTYYPPFVEKVENIGVLSEGRNAETLTETMLRCREGIRTGNLGRFFTQSLADFSSDTFLGRCVTVRDYQYYAKQLGATKVSVIPKYQFGSSNGLTMNRVEGYFPDLVTLVVYPGSYAPLIQETLVHNNVLGMRLSAIAAEIIPVTGTINVRAISSLASSQVVKLAQSAIASKINPPHGKWGDLQLDVTIAQALEEVEGIYAVPSMSLVNAKTGSAIDFSLAAPMQLFEIQNSITYNITS